MPYHTGPSFCVIQKRTPGNARCLNGSRRHSDNRGMPSKTCLWGRCINIKRPQTVSVYPPYFVRRLMALTLHHFQLLLYHTGKGNEARRARQPKVIDFRLEPDGET